MINSIKVLFMLKDIDNVYHGIIINISQKDRSVFRQLKVIGKKKIFFGLITLYKIEVDESNFNETMLSVQKNMTNGFLFIKQEFYIHFYRSNELVIVFRDKIFRVTTDKNSWGEALEYGLKLNIKHGQLDFIPNRFKDEPF
jgi:hypothetical protein